MKTKLVVINENMLGYILSDAPHEAGILASKITRGATHSPIDGVYPLTGSTVRLATEQDFDAYFVTFKGYNSDNSDEYEFAIA